MIFNESVHTASALAEEIDSIYRKTPDILLAGSLGRTVIFANILNNPQAEFQARGELPERTTEDQKILARDIDVIGELNQPLAMQPFEIDHKAFASRRVKFVQDGSGWFLVSEGQGLYEELHPAVMEPTKAESVYGTTVTTVPFQTHQALFGLKGAMRPKDKMNYDFLSSIEHLNKDRLPAELYEPFAKLRHLVNSGWFYHTRRAYRTVIPLGMRKKALPLTSVIKNKLA